MPTYTESAKVQNELPDSLPTGFVTANMTDLISIGSELVESLVGPHYAFQYNSNTQKFPNVTDTPATPTIIEICARWLAAAEGYVRLKEVNKLSGKDLESKFRSNAMDMLEKIANGDVVISVSGSNIQGTRVSNTTDPNMYDSDDTDPVFDNDSMGAFW